MANPHLSSTMAEFDATVQRTKNRLIAIPAEVQRQLGLERQPGNDIVLISVRKARAGRWNHHLLKLTFDNELALPADVTTLGPGDRVQVKVHAVYSGTPKPPAASSAKGAGLLLAFVARGLPGWRTDGSRRVDEHLNEEARARRRLR
jgi:hypothetical protein